MFLHFAVPVNGPPSHSRLHQFLTDHEVAWGPTIGCSLFLDFPKLPRLDIDFSSSFVCTGQGSGWRADESELLVRLLERHLIIEQQHIQATTTSGRGSCRSVAPEESKTRRIIYLLQVVTLHYMCCPVVHLTCLMNTLPLLKVEAFFRPLLRKPKTTRRVSRFAHIFYEML